MRIIVCIKQIPDLSNISVSRSQEMIFEKGPRVMSPADECALELALGIKDKTGAEIATLTLGDENCVNSLKTYLAAGADIAYLLAGPSFQNGDPLSATAALGGAIKKIGEFSLIITGAGSITGNGPQTGGRLAEYLGAHYLVNVRAIEYHDDRFSAQFIFDRAERREDVMPPAVISCAGGLKPLRIPAGLAIMKAAKKQILQFSPEDLGLNDDLLGERGAATRLVRPHLGSI